MSQIIVVADDLTGACDCGMQFSCADKSTKIVLPFNSDISNYENTDVISITTETRNLKKDKVKHQLDKVLFDVLKHKNAFFYKKTDSTLRGNIGLECLYLKEKLNKDAVIFAPAYPKEKRFTINGFQYIEDKLITKLDCAYDPKAPIKSAKLEDLFECKCVVLDVNCDTETLAKKIDTAIEQCTKVIIFNAKSENDLQNIAKTSNLSKYNLLFAGSAGLAEAFSNQIQNKIKVKSKKSIIFITGSMTNKNREQVEYLKNNSDIFSIDLKKEDIENNNNFTPLIKTKIKENKDIIIHTSSICFDKNLKDKISNYLSEILFKIKNENINLVLSGDECAQRCLEKLKIEYLDYITSITTSIGVFKDNNSRLIVLKSGNFGTKETYFNIKKYFKEEK